MSVWLDENGDECVAYLNGNSDNRNANLNRIANRYYRSNGCGDNNMEF